MYCIVNALGFNYKSIAMKSRYQIEMSSDLTLNIMINGLPGPMALETAISCLNRGYNIIPIGFTGGSGKVTEILVNGDTKSQLVQLIPGPGFNDNAETELIKLKGLYKDILLVDYTHPSATLSNVQCYINCQCDFVMGTTGGDQQKLDELFSNENNKVTAVIAPNMGKQIVAMQAALLQMSKRFPKSFEGYQLQVLNNFNPLTYLLVH